MKPLSRLLVALCLSPLLVQAAPFTQVTLPDGRQVQLNDDFTWEYLLLRPADGSAVQGTVAVPVLTEQAMSNPELLAQAVKDGIGVKLAKVEGSDPLQLQFMVSNTGTRNVVRVRGSVTLFSEQGPSWPSRRPASGSARTVCRSPICAGAAAPSMVLEVPRPTGLTGKPLVRVEIEEVEFR